MNKYLPYITVFMSGYIMLSLELLGIRLLAPFFGYSLYVFGALIGVILLALSLGYMLGGYWSENKQFTERRFFSFVFISALYLSIISLYHAKIVEVLSRLHIITGALLSSLILFAFPMIMLASISPYLTKTLTKRGQAVGASSGAIYATGTLGSLIGTFATSFYLVPAFGVNITLISNVLLMFSLAFLWIIPWKYGFVSTLGILILLTGLVSAEKNPSVILAQVESPYNHLEIVDYKEFIGLRTDRRNGGLYSLYPKEGYWQYPGYVYDFFAIPPLINGAQNGLLLGLGAGTIPLIHQEISPNLMITGVEIDPNIIELGKQYFHLSERHNLQTVLADARPFLVHSTLRYDLIEIDLFWGGGEIPFYLSTKEFFALTLKNLTDKGILVMNVYDPSQDQKIFRPLINTIASVYPKTSYIRMPFGSYFILATHKPLDYSVLDKAIKTVRFDKKAYTVAQKLKKEFVPWSFNPRTSIFTDNWAPLEKLTYEAVFSTH